MTGDAAPDESARDAGRVSLHPLSFEEALGGLVAVKPKLPDDDEKEDRDGGE